MQHLYNDDGLNIVVKGFCPVDVLEIWKAERLDSYRYLRGDYLVKITEDNKTIYITDFAGSQSPRQLPRNSTIVIENNEIVYCKQNWNTTKKYYIPPQGFERKSSFDDFFQAIDDAVALRCIDSPTITMSCGHDSGVIAASALKQNLKFNALSLRSIENEDVLEKRTKLVNGTILDGFTEGSGHDFIVNFISDNVVISGLGADELYVTGDDELLAEFFADTIDLYASRGIEHRFPLSDYSVWKEYFSLDERVIKKANKSPFKKYMEALDFPVHYGQKVSFGI
jgi:asparagine synthetase B (glutamine-hydrolysing)